MNRLPGTVGEPAVQPFRDFRIERVEFLNEEPYPALIPFRHADGRLDHWPEALLRKLKKRIQGASGVRFRIQTVRSTFGQRAKDDGTSIEAVSRAMRHRTTRTSEMYYARVRPDRALEEVRRAQGPAKVEAVD